MDDRTGATITLQEPLGALGRLLVAGRYEEAARAMAAAGSATPPAAPWPLGEAMRAARQVCLSCLDYRSQARSHREAAREAAALERRMREHALAILRVAAGAAGPHEGPAPRGASPARTIGPAGPSAIEARCLGPLRVVVDGRPMGRWPSRRSRSLFKYLLLHRSRPAPREVLMELLCPGAHPAAARNGLNVAVHHVRRALGGGDAASSPVRHEDGAYRLDPALEVWVDAEEHERLVAAGRRAARAGDAEGAARAYGAALDLYAGDLFDDDPYEEWAFERRRAIQEEHLRALAGLGEARLALGDAEAAADAFRAALAADPCREEAHRGLMRCHAMADERHLALRQYRECARALRAGLRIAPSPETAALERAIRAGHASAIGRPGNRRESAP